MFHVPNQFRNRTHPTYGSDETMGKAGMFEVPVAGVTLLVIADDGETCRPPDQWEHVSVSTADRCPTWEEMSAIVALFWDAEDTVIQLHPPRSHHINRHPYTLHLWRSVNYRQPMPPKWMV